MALAKLRTRRTRSIESINNDTLASAIDILQRALNEFGPEATLNISQDDYYGSDYEVEWWEEESDEAYAARVAKHEAGETERKRKKAERLAAREAAREEIDRKLYEKLKQKFEGGGK